MRVRIKNYVSAVIFVIIMLPVYAIEEHNDELFNPVEIKNGSTITVLDCVAYAYKNNPKIKKQKYNLDIAKSNLGAARAQYFPVINAGAGFYNENNSNNIYYDTHYRDLPSVAVSVNQLIWNFGKTTSYIKMEEFYKIGAEYEFMDSLCSVLFDVKAKYYDLLKEKALFQAAELDVELSRNILDNAFETADILNAETNIKKSEVRLNERAKLLKNSAINLSNSMYFTDNVNFDIKNTLTFPYDNDFVADGKKNNIKPYKPQLFNFKIEDAAKIAYENSPDLQVLIAEKGAMQESLNYIKKTYLPDLTGTAGYGYNNILHGTNNSLKVGVNLNSSVNLMELRHNIKGADAHLKYADEEINRFKQDLFFELKRAFNNVEKSEEKIKISLNEVDNALKTYEKVFEKYKGKELNYLNIQAAKTDYINAINEYIKSLYEYNISLIQVEMAMHYHITDIHHKSEHAMHYHSEELIEHLNKVLGCDEHEKKDKHQD